MKILAAVICCEYKSYSLEQCLKAIKSAGIDCLLNFEGQTKDKDLTILANTDFLQVWTAVGNGFNSRKFDQDQSSRLTKICVARNMVFDFFQQTDYDYLLFVDSDVIIPKNTIENLIFDNHLRSGLVYGRGDHKGAKYLFYPKETEGAWTKVDYATCGFLLIPRDIVFKTRFRWGLPQEGGAICSEDPLFGSDCRKLGVNWFVNTDLVAEHLGELNEGETSQF
jgi:hypothetical protein